MHYVDGFLVAVTTARRDEYRRLAEAVAQVYLDLGALAVSECWGDDVPEGKLTSFPLAVQRRDDETVVFAWVAWPSKAARDAGMARFMDDPRIQAIDPAQMPFDGQRMIFGGFEQIVQAP